MALNQLGLGFLFTARDEASHVIHKLERSLGHLNTTQKESMKSALVPGALGAGGMWAGWKGFKGIFNVAKEAGEFKQILNGVKVLTHATDAEIAKSHDALLASVNQFEAKTTAEGLRNLVLEGNNLKTAMELLNPTLLLAGASLGKLTPDRAGSALVQTLRAFKIEAKDAGKTVDELNTVFTMFSGAAEELPAWVGKVSRGASVYKAGMKDAMIAVGMARNILGTPEVAATGVSRMYERLVDPKVQKTLHSIGVEVVNNEGKFRSTWDVLGQVYEKTKGLSEATASANIFKAFGNRALGAVEAIFQQMDKGIEDSTGKWIKGMDVIRYFQNAPVVSAQKFMDAYLDNLPGQLEVFKAELSKVRTLVGEFFESMFADQLRFVRHSLTSFKQWLISISPETKKALGQIALVVTGLVTAFGGLLAIKAGIVLLTVVLGALKITLGSVVLFMAPVAAGLLVLAGLAYLVYQAYKTNFGGFADFINGVWQKVSLAVRGLVQVFSKGEFSGAVMDEIDKAENSGVKSFVITLYMWGARIKNFFVGIGEGFMSAYDRLKPIFSGFLEALRGIAGAFGVTVGAADDNRNSFEAFGETGRLVGRVLADLAGVGLTLLTWALGGVSKAVNVCHGAWDSFGSSLGGSLQALLGVLQIVWGLLGDNGSVFWRGVINTSIGAVKIIVNVIYGLVGAFAWVFDKLAAMSGYKTSWGETVKAEQALTIGKLNDSASFWKREADAAYWQPGKSDDGSVFVGHPPGMNPNYSSTGASPSVAAAEAQKQASADSMKQLAELFQRTLSGKDGSHPAAPQQVNVNVDGQNILQVLLNAAKANASQSYMSPAAETP